MIPNSVQLFCMGTSVVFDRGDVAVPLRKQNNRLDVPVTFRVTCGACDQKFSNGGEKDFASVYTACAREDGQLGQARSIPGVTMVYFVASVLWRSLVVSHELIDAPDDHGAFRFILAWRPLLLDKQRLVSDAILRQFPILYTVTPPGGVDMLLDHDRTVISMARFRQLAAQIARSVRLNDQRYADRARQLLSYPGVHMLLASPRHGLSGNVCFVSFYRFVFLVDLSNAQMPAGDDVRALTLNNPFTDFQSRPMAVNRLVSMLAGANDSAVAPFDESSHDEWRDSGLDCISSDRLEQFHCPNSLLDDLSEDLYLRFCRCGPIECRTVCSPQGTPGLSPLTQAYIAEYRLRDQKIQACASFVDVISVVEPAYMYCLKADIIPNSVQIRPASAQLRRVHLVHAVTRAVVEVQSSTNATSLMFGCVMLAHSCHLLGDDLRAAGADHVSVPFRYCTKLVCDSLRRSTGQMICCRASPSLIGADCWPGFPRRTELSGLLKDVLLACNLLDVRFTAFRPARQRAVRPA